MSSRHRTVHMAETYRFSATHTLSDYPLLIGEILRRDERRSVKEAKLQAFFYRLGRACGVRVRRPLGAHEQRPFTEDTFDGRYSDRG